EHLGVRLRGEGEGDDAAVITWRELHGPGALRYRVSARDLGTLTTELLRGASRRLGEHLTHVRELEDRGEPLLALPPEEQYLVATGRNYFRDLTFDDLRRFQFDLETTGLDPARDRVFMIAVRRPSGASETLEISGDGDGGEAGLIRRLVATIRDD